MPEIKYPATYIRSRSALKKVTLALYCLSSDDGLVCWASNKKLSESAGVSIEYVKGALLELEGRGDVVYLDQRDNQPGRCFVLMDHPDAVKFVEWFKNSAWNNYGPGYPCLESVARGKINPVAPACQGMGD